MARPGYLKLWRGIAEKPIWKQSTPEHKAILIQLLIIADFNGNEWEYKGETYTTKPGQFVTSLKNIAEECGKGISVQNVRSALARFERLGFITNESTKMNRLITIINWGVYQSNEEKSNKDSNNVTNSEVTKNQQRTNKEVTTNEEVKKLRSEEGKNINHLHHQDDVSDKDFKKIVDYYKHAIGMLNATDYNYLSQDVDKFGKGIVCKAIQEAGKNSAQKYKYINSILIDWANNGVKTKEDAERYLIKRKHNFKNKSQKKDEYYSPYQDMEFKEIPEDSLPF
ncbi:DnaD domain protein [Mammaliicoccus sciuri]|uniref:DnaD domain-containing protein n=1 Tax=Mammaliicoccus sciuri TaxID=1296 RepID=UPI002DC0259E|nr:DnaD domain protein [Mammaliicoccus sciuri]MEB7404981.1 DnaD domain protein [Mammaliicoccus sciuri]MEB8312757.1 DnaD domain protein [Mammaliicoccus sciuri]